MVPAGLKYPSHKLFEVSCAICSAYCKNWAAKNLGPMSLSAITMKANLFCSTVNASDTGGDPLSVFEASVCPQKWEMWEADRHRLLQIKEEWCFQKLFYWCRGRLKHLEADVTGYNNNEGTQNRNSLVLPAIGRSVLWRFSGSGYLLGVMLKK